MSCRLFITILAVLIALTPSERLLQIISLFMYLWTSLIFFIEFLFAELYGREGIYFAFVFLFLEYLLFILAFEKDKGNVLQSTEALTFRAARGLSGSIVSIKSPESKSLATFLNNKTKIEFDELLEDLTSLDFNSSTMWYVIVCFFHWLSLLSSFFHNTSPGPCLPPRAPSSSLAILSDMGAMLVLCAVLHLLLLFRTSTHLLLLLLLGQRRTKTVLAVVHKDHFHTVGTGDYVF